MLPNFIKEVIQGCWDSFKCIIIIIRWERSIQIVVILSVLLIISSIIFKGPLFEIVARKLGMFMLVIIGVKILGVIIDEQMDIVINEQISKNKSVTWIIVILISILVGIYMFRFFM